MLEIRDSDLSSIQKAKLAIQITHQSKVILPVLKKVGVAIKKLGWDDRTWSQRLGIGGGAIAALAFGGSAGAGIAALGTAIGVPLWVVFAGGGALLGSMLDSPTKSHSKGENER